MSLASLPDTFGQFEFKPGGRWIFVMHGPNGANCPNVRVREKENCK